MIKSTRIFIVTVLFFSKAIAQNEQQVQHLATLAKVWGFLKYYHPDAAKGKPDWDEELVRMIPLVQSAATESEFTTVITGWYNSLPKAKLSATIMQVKNDSIERVFDESDIARFGVPPPLVDELARLYLYHRPGDSKYITDRSSGHILDYIKHTEEPYDTPTLPDEAHRLLALFRYWNIIDYFYPYKKINAPGWDKVLPDFIPRFITANDSTVYRETFMRLTTQLKDSHSFYYQRTWNRSHYLMNVPFTVTYIDGGYYISESSYDSLMKVLDFKIGDEIVGINGMTIARRIDELKPITTGTNELSFYRNIGNVLFKIDTNRLMRISIARNGQRIEKEIRLYTGAELSKLRKDARPLWEDLGNGVWHVNICDVPSPDSLPRLFAAIRNAKAVIWDMRAYPVFSVVQAMRKGLFAQSTPLSISYNSILEFPGALNKHIENTAYAAGKPLDLPLYTGKMIVLVNEQTQSLAESVAYGLRSRPNTIVMGRQTAGTTGNITSVNYPGGIIAYYTAVGVHGINGSFTEGKGVKIDKEIILSGKNLLESPDYMLKMALLEALK